MNNKKNPMKWATGAGFLILLFLSFTPRALADTTSALLPVADGIFKEFTPLTGATHYTMVNQASCDLRHTYNFTNTVGQRDSYKVDLSAVPNGSAINRIDIIPCAANNLESATAHRSVMNVFYFLDGQFSGNAGNYLLKNTVPKNLATTTFAGLDATKIASSTLEIGAVFSSGGRGVALSRMAAVVTYTPPPQPQAPSSLWIATLASTSTTTLVSLNWTDESNNETGFAVEMSADNVNFNEIANLPANTTSVSRSLNPGTYYFRVRAYNTFGYSGYSNTAIKFVPCIVTPPPTPPQGASSTIGSLTVISPNGGECLPVGSTKTITWSSSPNIDMVSIGYSFGPSSLNWIAFSIPNTGSFDWVVGIGNTVNTQVKIDINGYDVGVGSVNDVSDAYFTVY